MLVCAVSFRTNNQKPEFQLLRAPQVRGVPEAEEAYYGTSQETQSLSRRRGYAALERRDAQEGCHTNAEATLHLRRCRLYGGDLALTLCLSLLRSTPGGNPAPAVSVYSTEREVPAIIVRSALRRRSWRSAVLRTNSRVEDRMLSGTAPSFVHRNTAAGVVLQGELPLNLLWAIP